MQPKPEQSSKMVHEQPGALLAEASELDPEGLLESGVEADEPCSFDGFEDGILSW